MGKHKPDYIKNFLKEKPTTKNIRHPWHEGRQKFKSDKDNNEENNQFVK